MLFKFIAAAATILWLSIGSTLAQNQAPSVKTVAFSDNATQISLYKPDGSKLGSNVFVIAGETSVLLIDAHFNHPFLASLIQRSVDELAPERENHYLLNTHWHPDHTGGNGHVNNAYDHIAQLHTYEHLRDGDSAVGLGQPDQVLNMPAQPPESLPEIIMYETLSLNDKGLEIELVHVPNAHTDGDVIVMSEGRSVVYLGDLVWPGDFPSVDFDNGGSASGIEQALRKILLETPDEAVFGAGHGSAPVSREEVTAYADMIAETIEVVSNLHASGMSLDEAKASGALEAWADWGSALVPQATWIEIIWHGL